MNKDNILIVDDTTANLQLLEAILDDQGYEVRTSLSGEMALKAIQIEKPDLVLLDIMMPQMDGYETCQRIKANSEWNDVPVIFLSAKSEASDKVRGFQVGGVDYISKPFDIDEILIRIQTHLKISHLQKELKQKVNIIDKYVIASSTDNEGYITSVSEAFCEISGYTKEELLGKKHSILRHEEMPDELYVELWKSIKEGKIWKGDIKNRKKDGSFYWVYVIISPVFDAQNEIVGFSSIRQDITDKKRVEQLSITDQLTGLFNRRHYNDMVRLQINQATRHGYFLSLIMLDIDYFKQYNDTYGHQRGDRILENMGKTLKEQLKRIEDMSFRLGGEEFGILCATKKCEDVQVIAESIQKSIEALAMEHKASKVSSCITASIGIACVDYSKQENYACTEDELYKRSDEALYRAKEKGRNRVELISL